MAHGYKATEIAWSADVGSSAERLTLLALAKWANDDLTCFPSIATLSAETKLNAKTVRESLKRLGDAGIVTINRQAGRNSIYAITTTEIGTTKNGSTEIVTTSEIGSTPPPKTDGVPLPKTVPEQITEQITEQINLSVGDSPFSLEPDLPLAANEACGDKAAKKAPKSREHRHPFDLKGLPDKWRQYIVKVRPDLDPEVVFTDFAFYWTEGQGRGERRTERGWSSTWMTWVRRQNNQRSPAARPPKKQIPDHLNPKIRFDESYYTKENPFNPDGSLNWKRAPDTDRNE